MSDLLAEKTGHIATLKLNRPDRMNAISVAMLTTLGEKLKEYDGDPDVRVIILTGEGRGFCSGLDLERRRRRARDRRVGRAVGGRWRGAYQHLRYSDRDTQSYRHSRYLRAQRRGRGLRIRSRARMRPAHHERSREAGSRPLPSAESCRRAAAPGICRGWSDGPTPARSDLSPTISRLPARSNSGLANKVVPHDNLMPEALAWAEKIAANAPLGVRAMKRLFRHATQPGFRIAYASRADAVAAADALG